MKHHETTSHPVANVSHCVRVLEQTCDFDFAEVYLWCGRPASAILSWALHGCQHTVRRPEHARGQRVPIVRLHILLLFLLFLFRSGVLAMNHKAAATSTCELSRPPEAVAPCWPDLPPTPPPSAPSAPPSATRSWRRHVQLLHHDDRHQRRHSTTRAGWSDQPTLRSRNRVPQPPWPLWPSSGSAERRPAARCGASQLPQPQRTAAALRPATIMTQKKGYT